MTHIVGGYPSLLESEALAHQMISSGVNLLEIQIPFSDPIADGPTIVRANTEALLHGITPEDCFLLMERLSAKTTVPLLFMTYFNIVFRFGVENFCRRAKQVGAHGLIVPDMPIDEEEHEHYLKYCRLSGLHAIQVISPITPERRLKRIAEQASGFVYCVARTGTTGESEGLDEELMTYIKRVKKYISLPIALGFGISTPDAVKKALTMADIAVIGSKIITTYDELGLVGVENFLQDIIVSP